MSIIKTRTKCIFCGQSYQQIYNHSKYCKKNPNKVQHYNLGHNNGMRRCNYDYETLYKCKYCNYKYSLRGLKFHQRYCQDNPNKIKSWRQGIKLTQQHKNKCLQALKRFRRNGGVAHGIPHTQQTKQKLRLITIGQITRGQIKRTSLKQKELYEYIKTLRQDRILQYNRGHYSIDIAVQKLMLRFQFYGDFWHRNLLTQKYVKVYDVQKRNLQNDIRKKEYLLKKGWTLFIVWQNDWKNNRNKIQEEIKCLILSRIRQN